ncbi:hypothetical protein A5658_11480 [Mycobacterium sp. 1245111.1]|nr:hypothetical protein A5658_11480 [Mycobacterium sp. 1245111.1]
MPAPADIQPGEVVVALQPEGLLVGGDPDAIEPYLGRIREIAGQTVRVAGINKTSLANATGLLTGATSLFGQAGKFVQLHPDSYQAIKQGNLIPGTDGFYRMMTRGADNKFLHQLQWRPTAVNPAQLMSAQMVAVQLALKTAIAEVEEAVRRVEGKVDQVLKLAQAHRTGDVLGNYTTISRLVTYLESHGAVPDALWDSVATLGPVLNSTVEQLRNHVDRTLNSLDPDEPVQDRARALGEAVTAGLLTETLNLLVVSEESLFRWQRVLLARVEATQPEHLSKILNDSQQLLAQQLAADGELYRRARTAIADFGTPKAIDGFRFFSVRDLTKHRDKLHQDLDDFARARHHQVQSWEALAPPSISDAADATVEIARKSATQALTAAGEGLLKLSDMLNEQRAKKEPLRTDQPKSRPDSVE